MVKHKEDGSPTSLKEKEERESTDGSVSEYNGSSVSSSSDSDVADDASQASSPAPSPKKSPSKKGKKIYQCNHSGCGRIFTTSGHLSRHRRIHSGVKNYRCPLKPCAASFFRSDNMMTHFKVHAKRECLRHDVDPQILVAASTGIWPQALMARIDAEMETQAREAGLVIGCGPPTPIDPESLPPSPKRKRNTKPKKSLAESSEEEAASPMKKRGGSVLESPTKTLAGLTHGLTLQTASPTKQTKPRKIKPTTENSYEQAVSELAQTLGMVQHGAQQAGLNVVGVQSLAEHYLMNLEQKIKQVDSPVTPNSALVRLQLSDGTMLDVLGPSSDLTKNNVFMDLLARGEDGKQLAAKMVQEAVERCRLGQASQANQSNVLTAAVPPVTVSDAGEEPSLGLFTSSMDLLGGLHGHLFSMGSSSNSLLGGDKFLTSATTPVTGSKDESTHMNLTMETTPVSAHDFVLETHAFQEDKSLPPLPPQDASPFDLVNLDESPKSSEMPWLHAVGGLTSDGTSTGHHGVAQP